MINRGSCTKPTTPNTTPNNPSEGWVLLASMLLSPLIFFCSSCEEVETALAGPVTLTSSTTHATSTTPNERTRLDIADKHIAAPNMYFRSLCEEEEKMETVEVDAKTVEVLKALVGLGVVGVVRVVGVIGIVTNLQLSVCGGYCRRDY